jgi:putative ABC transport system ATP-binding protein
MALILAAENLTYRYPGQSKPVFCDLSFEIPAGARVGLLGRSGVGKSTLLYVLGLLWEGELGGGTVRYWPSGADGVWDYRCFSQSAERSRLRLVEFGFVFQNSVLLPHLTCEENIALPLILQGWPRREWLPRARRLLGLAEHSCGELTGLARRLGPFSGGQVRRIALLRAVVHDPRVLLADEPFSNLDAASIQAVLQLLEAWHRGQLRPEQNQDATIDSRTLIVATHDLEEAWALCDHFLVLSRNGELCGGRLLRKEEVHLDQLRRMIDSTTV